MAAAHRNTGKYLCPTKPGFSFCIANMIKPAFLPFCAPTALPFLEVI
jgi:hypothetical protein